MTELSFLIDLLLNHKLPRTTSLYIAERIKEVQAKTQAAVANIPTQWNSAPLAFTSTTTTTNTPIPDDKGVLQAPSTIAAMQRQATGESPPPISTNPMAPQIPIVTSPIAVSPQAQAALQKREELMAQAMGANGPFGGKPERGRSGPRKF